MGSFNQLPEPVLDLSGPCLRGALDALGHAASEGGGIGAFVEAIALKARLFAEVLNPEALPMLDRARFLGLVAFMPTVRRRIGAFLDQAGFPVLHARIRGLLASRGEVEARAGDFIACFANDRAHRWVRDLAAELLHFSAPEQVPLMTRWVWDSGTRTGVLREIWHDDSLDRRSDAPTDRLPTFRTLAREVQGFLREEGYFRDLALVQDLLFAHIYATYINDRGATYIKGDIAGAEDRMGHTSRLLGLDAIDAGSGTVRHRLVAVADRPVGAVRLVQG